MLEKLFVVVVLICFAVWLVGVFFGWFQTFSAGGPRNPLLLMLAILIVLLLLRELGLFSSRGRIFCMVPAHDERGATRCAGHSSATWALAPEVRAPSWRRHAHADSLGAW